MHIEVRHVCAICGSSSTPRVGSVGNVIYRRCGNKNCLSHADPAEKVVRFSSTEVASVTLVSGEVIELRKVS